MGSVSVLEPSIKGDDKGKKDGESERVITHKKKKTKKRKMRKKKEQKY